MDRATSLTEEFVRYLDVHRMPHFETGLSDPWNFFAVDAAFVVLAALLLTVFRRLVPDSARPLLIALLAITAVGTVFTVVDEISPGFFPLAVKGLMITRWLNWNTVLLPVLLISLLGYMALRHRSILALLGLFLALLPVRSGLAAAAVVAAVAYALLPPIRVGVERVVGFSYSRVATPAAGGLAVLSCAALFAGSMFDARGFELEEDNPVWAEADRGEGLMIVAPYFSRETWPQLRAQRGIVFDTRRLDVLAYAPAAAPGVEEILNDIYATSIRDARSGMYARTELVWANRTSEEWRALGERYGATDLLVESGWDPRLPLTSSSGGLELYRIPGSDPD